MTDHELDAALRTSEAAAREHAVRHAALVAVVEHRRSYSADGHRTLAAYLRATCDTSGRRIGRQCRLARLIDAQPDIGEALLAHRFSVDHALEIGRILANPRVAHLLPLVIDVFIELAEHRAYDHFRGDVDEFIRLTDADGAFADLAAAVEGRDAHVSDVGGTLAVSAEGGDPVTSMQFVAVFESFVEGELRNDVEARRAEHGRDADGHPLPRTPAQRRYDAMIAMAAAAAAAPEGRALPEPTTHIVIDERSAHETLTHSGITLPNGNEIELDADGGAIDVALLGDLADELLADPEAFRSRRCEPRPARRSTQQWRCGRC